MAGISLKRVGKRYTHNKYTVKDISLTIADGEFIVFVGPSGCGKTTTLNMIAGLETVTEGDIFIDDQKVNDVPAKDRDIAMVFQSYALYPHMTVRGNISFPLEMAHCPKSVIATKVTEIAALLDLTDVLDRKPSQLSGGQRQRVAMGRALVRRPKAFLMDEPLSNLDAKLRSQMRNELLHLHRQLRTTTIYVTHDQVEAMTLGDRLVVFADGTIQQIGTPQELYNNPKNIFVAGFIGSPAMNFLPAQLIDSGVRTPIGEVNLPNIEFLIERAKKIGMSDNSVIIGIRPESIFIQDSPIKNPHNIYFSSPVDFVETLGIDQLVHVNISTTRFTVSGTAAKKHVNYVHHFTDSGNRREVFDLTARISHHKPISIGSVINIVTPADAILIFDPATGYNLQSSALE